MTDQNQIMGRFRYEEDTKNFHRFQIETDDGILGIVYIPKELKPMPKTITLAYAGKSEG